MMGCPVTHQFDASGGAVAVFRPGGLHFIMERAKTGCGRTTPGGGPIAALPVTLTARASSVPISPAVYFRRTHAPSPLGCRISLITDGFVGRADDDDIFGREHHCTDDFTGGALSSDPVSTVAIAPVITVCVCGHQWLARPTSATRLSE